MAHLNLVTVHPFSDGNGRMARALQTLIIARSGISAPEFSSIEEYLRAHTAEYYQVLSDVGTAGWNPGRDASPWVRFSLTAHFRQATLVMRRSDHIQQLWDKLEQAVNKLGLPERCILALADAAVGYRIRNVTYRAAAQVSDQVASRDLREIVKAGLLVAAGEKRGRTYSASPLILDMKRGLKPPKADEDPYAER
jgi:Fic family protein